MTTLDDLQVLRDRLGSLCVQFDKTQEWGKCSPEALELFRRNVREAIEDAVPRLASLPLYAIPHNDVPLPVRLGSFTAASYCHAVLDSGAAVDYRLECRMGKHPVAEIVRGIRDAVPFQDWHFVAQNVERELIEAAQRAVDAGDKPQNSDKSKLPAKSPTKKPHRKSKNSALVEFARKRIASGVKFPAIAAAWNTSYPDDEKSPGTIQRAVARANDADKIRQLS